MPRIGFFTRLLDEGTAAQRYRWAIEQIQQAERVGFSTAWVAQHHFDADEGGLPTPWPLLGAAAQATTSIRLGTAVVTLPHENPVRTAEDAAVLDILSDGRVELGVASGASPENLKAFGYGNADARELFNQNLPILRDALAGKPLAKLAKYSNRSLRAYQIASGRQRSQRMAPHVRHAPATGSCCHVFNPALNSASASVTYSCRSSKPITKSSQTAHSLAFWPHGWPS